MQNANHLGFTPPFISIQAAVGGKACIEEETVGGSVPTVLNVKKFYAYNSHSLISCRIWYTLNHLFLFENQCTYYDLKCKLYLMFLIKPYLEKRLEWLINLFFFKQKDSWIPMMVHIFLVNYDFVMAENLYQHKIVQFVFA